jgi:uncharacterized membrane protein
MKTRSPATLAVGIGLVFIFIIDVIQSKTGLMHYAGLVFGIVALFIAWLDREKPNNPN